MNLYLPAAKSTNNDPSNALTARTAKRWVESLPLVNMNDATRQFYQDLQAFNRSTETAKQRYDAMQRLVPPGQIVHDYLFKKFSNNAFPLARKSKQVHRLTTAFLQEMSVGYKLIISEVHKTDVKLDQKTLATTCHHAIYYLYQIMLLNAQTYTQIPGKIWHDMHQIYEFAEKLGVAEKSLKSIEPEKTTECSVKTVYLKCCLIGLCEPYGLRNGEAAKLNTLLDKLIHLCDISKVLNADEDGVLHVIGLHSSDPPVHVKLAELTTFSNLRGLDIKKLLQYLERKIVDEPEELAPLPELAARRLLDVWSKKEKRRFRRVDVDEKIIAAIGINDILHAINSDKYPTMSGPQIIQKITDEEAAKTTPGLSLSTTQFNINPKDETWYKTTVTDPRYPDSWHHWRLANTSAGGYGLIWENPQASRAQVGDVIALREYENNRYQWRMGQIMWLQHDENDELGAGVRMLAPRTVIATVHEVESSSSKIEVPIDIIMLPGMKTFKQPPSILATKDAFSVNDRLLVSMLGKQLTVKLKTTGENQNFFTQFYYQSSQMVDKPDEREEFETLFEKQ